MAVTGRVHKYRYGPWIELAQHSSRLLCSDLGLIQLSYAGESGRDLRTSSTSFRYFTILPPLHSFAPNFTGTHSIISQSQGFFFFLVAEIWTIWYMLQDPILHRLQLFCDSASYYFSSPFTCENVILNSDLVYLRHC